MRVPPKWVRRPIAWLLLYLLVTLSVLSSPVLVLAAVIASYFLPGRLRVLRLFGFAMTGLLVEAAAVLVAGALWIASGFGAFLRREWCVSAHYAVLRWALAVLTRSAMRLFYLEVKVDAPSGERLGSRAPILVLSRHAGPGDSLLVMSTLMSQFHRRPRVVLKDTMQLDPTCDLYLNRIPARFVNPNPGIGEDTPRSIALLAREMGPDDALLIFPEGGNFTPKRRERAISRLYEAGYFDAAELAKSLRNVLPPRPAGVNAALGSAPEADVVFVAHTGLDSIVTVADIWAQLPEDKLLSARWLIEPADQVPQDEAHRAAWLNEHWLAIDRWIEATKR